MAFQIRQMGQSLESVDHTPLRQILAQLVRKRVIQLTALLGHKGGDGGHATDAKEV